ncbi:hypothetical protein QIA_1528 [Clostridioides difficile 6057]|nr:hypothetical protein QCM_1504 [Clostridioides difficile CD46]EQE78889.1 hypothetical protein QCS_1507 [Clostridioides difficile CD51]EQF11525.1 hypothetical protein QEO_1635 [Clostridioides difficile CD133]EQG12136.1 hypothetical protein QIA_1528 [Clostridioides difficile 6057]EQH48352.1 hypothetical protein QME_1518 [Clostridioides difficile DA00246]EQI06086.1 hypothetical protein QOG_1570 [Clostridioides difficile Y10]EQI18679.1 hypothetical protein QOK_1597 [Clostridioides difficile Y41
MKIIFILKNMNENSRFYKKTYLDFNISKEFSKLIFHF